MRHILKKTLLLVPFLAAVLCCSPPEPGPSRPEPPFQIADVTVGVRTKIVDKTDVGLSMCHGVAVGPRTVVTAAHCAPWPEATEDFVETYVTTQDLLFGVRTIAYPTSFLDVAWLELYQEVDHWTRIGKPTPNAYWYRRGQMVEIQLEEVTDMEGVLRSPEIGIPGDSGSGVFNTKGELIGVVSQIGTDPRDHVRYIFIMKAEAL